MTNVKEIREALKANGLKRTDVNVTSGKGSSEGMAILTIRTKGSYKIAKMMFGDNDNIHISCSNALMD